MPKKVARKPARSRIARAGGKRGPVVVSHPADKDFQPDGLRPYFLYRDLGIDRATKGRFGAHVIRARDAMRGGQGKHTHALGFQLVYLLKGKARFWYEGFGSVDMVAGSSVYQPPGIRHEMLSCSKNCEILEITMPAEFVTRAA
jgi:mannose-6-phosphate isomerase-like protein (cupin superfamily)